MARPKKNAALRKSRTIEYRLDETQYEIIEKYAAQAGMTISEYARHQAIYGKVNISYPIVADLPELQKLTNEFAAIGNNLNQIAKYFNLGGLQSKAMREAINDCMAEIMKMRKAVMDMAGDFNGCSKTSLQ